MHKTSLVVAMLLLTGCAVTQEQVQSTPTAYICHQLMTLPSYNIHHPTRWAELQRRGESCGNPADIARVQQNADALNAELLMQGAAILATPQPRAPRPVTCVQNGRMVTCY